jgi:superfamily II DNA or RNA helicase
MVKASNVGGLIINATGTGKTRIAGMYFQRLEGYGVFIVDELTLLDQARKELSKFLGEKVGIIGDMKFKPRRITVATIQTLHKHRYDKGYDKWRRQLEVIFIDEIHLALNRRNLNTVSRIPVKAIFGLTATLELNKKDVRLRATALAGPVIYEYPLDKGVKEKYLTPGVVVGVDIVEDAPDMKMEYRDLYDLMVADNRLWNEVIARLVEVGYEKGKHILVIVERVKHLK